MPCYTATHPPAGTAPSASATALPTATCSCCPPASSTVPSSCSPSSVVTAGLSELPPSLPPPGPPGRRPAERAAAPDAGASSTVSPRLKRWYGRGPLPDREKLHTKSANILKEGGARRAELGDGSGAQERRTGENATGHGGQCATKNVRGCRQTSTQSSAVLEQFLVPTSKLACPAVPPAGPAAPGQTPPGAPPRCAHMKQLAPSPAQTALPAPQLVAASAAPRLPAPALCRRGPHHRCRRQHQWWHWERRHVRLAVLWLMPASSNGRCPSGRMTVRMVAASERGAREEVVGPAARRAARPQPAPLRPSVHCTCARVDL